MELCDRVVRHHRRAGALKELEGSRVGVPGNSQLFTHNTLGSGKVPNVELRLANLGANAQGRSGRLRVIEAVAWQVPRCMCQRAAFVAPGPQSIQVRVCQLNQHREDSIIFALSMTTTSSSPIMSGTSLLQQTACQLTNNLLCQDDVEAAPADLSEQRQAGQPYSSTADHCRRSVSSDGRPRMNFFFRCLVHVGDSAISTLPGPGHSSMKTNSHTTHHKCLPIYLFYCIQHQRNNTTPSYRRISGRDGPGRTPTNTSPCISPPAMSNTINHTHLTPHLTNPPAY